MKENIISLQNSRESPCISVIVSLENGWQTAQQKLKQLITDAGHALAQDHRSQEAAPLLQALGALAKTEEPGPLIKGIGIYVSPRISLFETFPFSVADKVIVGKRFDLRDLQFKSIYASPYFLLVLSKTGSRLFEGRWDQLQPIEDDHFPMRFEDDYEYEKPAGNVTLSGRSHLKIMEPDRSRMEMIRLEGFFRDTDRAVAAYLSPRTPLIVCAVEREIACYHSITRHRENIISTIKGNHEHDTIESLAGLSWVLIEGMANEAMQQQLINLDDFYGEGAAVKGFRRVWRAVKEGRCIQLLLEQDYRQPAYLPLAQPDKLYLQPPNCPHKRLFDAIGEMVNTVLKQQGEIVYLKNGMLQQYNHIACITRF